MLIFALEDPTHDDARALIAALDADIMERYPGQPVHGIEPATLVADGGAFLVGRQDGRAVACGALRSLSADTGEVKRMYAIALYDAAGYRRILPFGEYAGNSYSVCFEKHLR